MSKTVIRNAQFRSKSSPGTVYTALLYADGSASCNCPSWTRRVADDGSRTCLHLVAAGYTPISAKAKDAAVSLMRKPLVQLPGGKFPKLNPQPPAAKIGSRVARRIEFED